LRPQESWPRSDIFLDRESGIAMVYASPVNKETGIIGDFGLTLYFGKDKNLQEHLATSLQTNREIFEYVKEDMELRDVNAFTHENLKSNGLMTNLSSPSDPTGTNIGHTIPASYQDWSMKEKQLLHEGKWEEISKMISKKRVFLNSKEKLRVRKGMAFTIEPRPQSAQDSNLPTVLFHTIALFRENGEKELLTDFDELFSLTGMDYMNAKDNNQKITYSDVGDNYETKDPIKKLIQIAAKATGKNLKTYGFEEVADSRGESAYVWQQGNTYMASVVEGLGTKNLIADDMYTLTGTSYYDVIAHDTVATIINDLVTVGATPLVVHAYWAIEDNSWLYDTKRMKDFVTGWANACTLSGASWGGGETATMKQVLLPGVAELAGSAIGIIPNKKRLILDKNLAVGDRIILFKSNGVNANGISLTRAIAKKLPKGYATLLSNGKTYGESLLAKSNVYAKVIKGIQDSGVSIHYISNITGHGMRKIMRARKDVTYRIEKIFQPQEVFTFIQKQAGLTDKEMYETYNMGMDYALFVSEKDAEKVLQITKKYHVSAYNAGIVEKGPRQVIIEPLNIILAGESLQLR